MSIFNPKFVKVYVRKGPAKGKSWVGTLMTPVEVGGNPVITNDSYPDLAYHLSEVSKVVYEKETESYLVYTQSGNEYILNCII